jgi:hypothetical protein
MFLWTKRLRPHVLLIVLTYWSDFHKINVICLKHVLSTWEFHENRFRGSHIPYFVSDFDDIFCRKFLHSVVNYAWCSRKLLQCKALRGNIRYSKSKQNSSVYEFCETRLVKALLRFVHEFLSVMSLFISGMAEIHCKISEYIALQYFQSCVKFSEGRNFLMNIN